jgi:hypothetical protein
MRGWTGAATLSAGDSVFFKTGQTWTDSPGSDSDYVLSVTAGVTYEGHVWGGGPRARIQSGQGLKSEWGVIVFNSDHATLPTVFRGFSVNGFMANNNGIRFMGNGTTRVNMTGEWKIIDDCVVDSAGADVSNYSYGICITSIRGFSGENQIPLSLKNVKVLNTKVIRSSRSGIVCYPSNNNDSNFVGNIVIRGCEICSTGTSPTSAAAAIVSKNWVDSLICEFNYLHDNIGTLEGGGVGILTDNNGIADTPGVSRNVFRYNIIRNCRTSAAQFYKSGGKGVSFYGNIIDGVQGEAIGINLNSHTNNVVRIFNNTIINCMTDASAYCAGAIAFTDGTYSFDTLEIANNIVIADSGGSGPRLCWYQSSVPNGAPTLNKNNMWYKPGVGSVTAIRTTSTTTYTNADLSTWESSQKWGLPNFTDSSLHPLGFSGSYGVSMKPTSAGFSLIGSPIDSGYTLPSTYSGAINFSGTAGGFSRVVPWDIGAYEYRSLREMIVRIAR